MRKILWLTSWYPSRVDPFTGDFIERHARAAAKNTQIQVLFVVKANNPFFPENKFIEYRRYPEGASATIIYYRLRKYRLRFFEKLISNFLYFRIYLHFIKKYINENGKPDGLHVHTGMKSGLVALFCKFRFGIPYVVSEHWAGFCPEAKPNFSEKPFLFRNCWKLVLQNAAGCSAVSQYLATLLENKFTLGKVIVIPNVVDSNMFFPSGKSIKNSRFIHVSGSNKFQKNIYSILDAAAILIHQLPEFTLVLFGTPDESVNRYIKKLKLENSVELKGMCNQEILREYMQESNALILYSRYETFGCVILEANACGKPVIVSNIPVFHENVVDGVTGVFVDLDEPGLLAEKMYLAANDGYGFNADKINKWVLNRYSFGRVGRQFAEFYDHCFT